VTQIVGSAEMARIVSQVTQVMLGLTFAPVSDAVNAIGASWKTAALPIHGGRPLTVAVSADEASGQALGAKMFGAAPHEVDGTMVADALCELVNMTAGLLKSALKIDQALGLPAICEREIFDDADGLWSHYCLRAGQLNLVLTVATRTF
jgi:hypothetical protein